MDNTPLAATAILPVDRSIRHLFIKNYDGEIYAAAYAAGTTVEACRALLRDERVREALRKRNCADPRLYESGVATPLHRKKLLTQIAWSERESTKDRLTAVRTLGEMEGDFIERRVLMGPDGGPVTTVNLNMGANMAVADLEERVRRLRERRVGGIEEEILG